MATHPDPPSHEPPPGFGGASEMEMAEARKGIEDAEKTTRLTENLCREILRQAPYKSVRLASLQGQAETILRRLARK